MFLQNQSLLNEKIAEFYKISSDEIHLVHHDVIQYFEIGGAYNTKKIVKLLWPGRGSSVIFNDLQTYKYEDYLSCHKKLVPIFQYTQYLFKTNSQNGHNDLKIKWLGKNINKYLEMKNKSFHNFETHTVEQILFLTSILENGLANVYFTKSSGEQVPHLLKDLINTTEIQDVFGIDMIIILKILMGSPNSINLRNIAWHGFPKPLEVPNYYVHVLVAIIHTMGCTLSLKKFELMERNQIVNFVKYMEAFEDDLKCHIFDFKYLEKHINENYSNLTKDFQPYWQQLLSYYCSKQYIEFIILILPQIELLLRLHYGKVNKFDITAKLEEYYVTMETIFQNTTAAGEKPNELLNFENSAFEGCFNLIYDVFISPSGCRLRDKVSHGEVYIEALDNSELSALVLHIFLNILLPKEVKTLQNYESKLHLNCLAKDKLNKNRENLQMFKLKYIENPLDVILINNSIPTKVLIFQRPKKESEFMLLIKKISENIVQTFNNYEESISVRSNLMIQRELHSKRRKTLEKLIATLPDIFNTLTKMWQAINQLYMLLQQDFVVILNDNENCLKSLRFLKHSLTISENFVKYSHYDSNEWIKSLDLCRKFKEFHTKLFLYNL